MENRQFEKLRLEYQALVITTLAEQELLQWEYNFNIDRIKFLKKQIAMCMVFLLIHIGMDFVHIDLTVITVIAVSVFVVISWSSAQDLIKIKSDIRKLKPTLCKINSKVDDCISYRVILLDNKIDIQNDESNFKKITNFELDYKHLDK